MIKRTKISLWLVCICSIQFIGAQSISRRPVDQGIILKRGFMDRVVGKLIDENKVDFVVLNFAGDTIRVAKKELTTSLMPSEIYLFGNRKFHYKDAFLLNYMMGFSSYHWNLNFSLSKRMANGLELGLGIGMHVNAHEVYTLDRVYYLNVLACPYYLAAKYQINKGLRRWYAVGRVGYMNNFQLWDQRQMKDGYFFDMGLGFMLPSRWRIRHYVELTQYSSSARGEMIAPELLSNISFKLRFHRVLFTYGIEIGTKRKTRRLW